MRKKIRVQGSGFRVQKFLILSLAFSFFHFALACYAKEITMLYTGETHAMLYHCSCPIEPDGGVARRAALIKELRKADPNILVLDSGGFFAGGLMDEYIQNTQLDMQRTIVNLKALDLMKYDALAVGDDEFNFGGDFFEQNIAKANLKLLSCNLKSEKVLPYLVKEFQGIKIGIIGVTNVLASQKVGGLKIAEPKAAVENAVKELQRKKTDVIVLLSHLGESEDLNLIKDVRGIDIVIVGHSRSQGEPSVSVGSTLILRPSWQGRRLCKLTLKLDDNKKISGHNVEELRLSDRIADDPEILAILPACFSDANCKSKDHVGTCKDGGSLGAKCLFGQAAKIKLLVITPKACAVCQPERLVDYLKNQLPGITPSYLYYPDAKSGKMIKDFNIKALPAYFLGKEIEKEKGFDSLKQNLELKGDYYMIKPQFSGFAYLLDRQRVQSKIDLFISLYDRQTPELIETIKDFKPAVHFLAIPKENDFEAANGNLETEDYLRALCIQKYGPQYFWDYLSCRSKNINTSWWEDCAQSLDTQKIKTCARTEEAKGLLRENIAMNKELQIMFGPTYLLNNQEIFGSKDVPTKEEFRKILQLEK